MPKPQPRVVPGYTYADIWPLVAYSSELNDLVETLADPANWDHNSRNFKGGRIQHLAEVVIQRCSERPQGPSTPIWWVTWACDKEHVWAELMAWGDEHGWKPVSRATRNNAQRPICPTCGAVDSLKARHRLGIKS